VVASDHTPIRIPRNVRVHSGPSGRISDTIDRKLEEVEWLLNYARNANKPIPVAFCDYDEKGECAETIDTNEVAQPCDAPSKDEVGMT
jgi:hypothetical protein